MKRVEVMEMIKNLLFAGAMAAFGVIFLIANLLTSDLWINFITWIFSAIGVYMIVHYFVNMKQLHNSNSLVLGIALLFGGAFMILFELYEFILYLFPIYLAVAGGLELGNAMHLKGKGCKAWWQPLVMAIIQLVLAALYLVIWRIVEGDIYMYLIGASLVIDGIYVCVAQFVYKHNCQKVEKANE